MEMHTNLVSLIRARAEHEPDHETYCFIESSGAEISLSNRELDLRARAIAATIGDRAGQRILLLFPPGLDYITAFFGCLYASAVAVPAYPPHPNRPKRSFARLQATVEDAGISLVLTTAAIASLQSHSGLPPSLPWLAVEDVSPNAGDNWSPPLLDEQTLAFLQYTSGSTASPKGVMVSHGNLYYNQKLIAQGFGTTAEDVIVSWLPLYHDMGLIGGVLHPLFLGARCYLMAPMDFLRRPMHWLETISRVGATVSGAPDFAYALVSHNVDAQELSALDLSRWKVAFSGAEPVRAETLAHFCQTFGPRGFRDETFYPCYGLAEATLFVSGGQRGRSPFRLTVDATALAENKIVPSENGVPLVSAGPARQQVRIVDLQNWDTCAPATVGEIWVAGPSVTLGYFCQDELNERCFGARLDDHSERFLRTGDLGFLYEHQLFITGRIKDLIIVRGRNHYPQDLELTTENCHPALAQGGGAAFSAEVDGSERLVIVHEVRRTALRDLPKQDVIECIRMAIAQNHQLQVHAVVLLKPGRLAKTSSGKVRRSAMRAAFLADELVAVETNILSSGLADSEPESLSRNELNALPTDQRRARLSAYLLDVTAANLGVASALLSTDGALTALGLDSLAVVRLCAHVKQDLAVELPMVQLLEGASLNQLTDCCLQLLEAEPVLAPSRLGQPAEGDFPLSYNQWALWFLYRLAPHSAAYHVSLAVDICSPHSPMELLTHFYQLVERHPMLRTRFLIRGSGVIQHVAATPLLFFRIAEGQDWSEDELNAYLTDEIMRPFDLEKGPPLRIRLISRGPDNSVLLVCAHHIVVDFQSMVTLVEELGRLCTDDSVLSAPPQASYLDFVKHQSELLNSPRQAVLEKFWTDSLGHDLPVLDLPTDRPRPSDLTFRGDYLSFNLESDGVDRLRTLAQQEATPLFSALLAAYAIFLARMANQDQLVIGTPASLRDHQSLAGTVGYMINTLPLRLDLAPAELGHSVGFRQLMVRVRNSTAAAMAHKDYPFQMMVEKTPLDRDRGRAPIFQALFVYLRPEDDRYAPFAARNPGARLDLGSLQLGSRKLSQPTTQFELSLIAVETGDQIHLTYEYNTDLFDSSTVARLAASFQTLLAAALANPDTHFDQLPLESEEERLAFLRDLNGASQGTFAPKLMFADFEAWAHEKPAATALVHGLDRMSYETLNGRANALAHDLRAEGLRLGERVAICHERGPDMVVAILAVLKAGGAYVPLDPNYPEDRLAYILKQSEARLVLAGAETPVPQHEGRIIRAGLVHPGNPDNPSHRAYPENLAYVIYTSGSTGKPKGVAITHRSAYAMLSWAKTVFSPEDLAGTLAATSICFDLSVFELFLPLSVGATIYLAENALQLATLPARDEVTLINTVPSAVAEIVHGKGIPDSVRIVNLAGELLTRELVAAIYARSSVVRVYDLYGPSEDTTYSTYTPREPEGPVSIGKPISFSRAYLLDRHLGPVVRGNPGELYLAGEGLSRGYLSDPLRSAERFLPDPFVVDFPETTPGARMYRSGDLVRYQIDPHTGKGSLRFLGRIDHQVKIRGFRIEPNEVAAVIADHPRVDEAVVVCVRDPELRLVAYLVAGAALKSSIVAFLHERLPAYMMPSAFVFLDSMPLTPNGKLDRQALPVPDPGRDLSSVAAPKTTTERVLARVWRELFHRQQIDRGDHFFDLGGHSLLATRFVSRMEAHFGISLPVAEVFAHPTLDRLAERVDAARRLATPDRPPLVRHEATGYCLPSFGQWRLWFLDRFESDASAYHMPMAVRLTGQLDCLALEHCFEQIVERHQALRSRFHEAGEQLRVETAPASSLTIAVVHLEQATLTRVNELAQIEANRPFDLARGPLFRLLLLRLGARDHVLLWTVHHIVSDGWSIGVLMHELNALYAAFGHKDAADLPGLPVQYCDFAHWQRAWLQGDVLATQIAFWREHLAGAPPLLELPTDRARPSKQTYRGKSLTFSIDKQVTHNLKKLANNSGTSLFMTLIGAYATLLSRYSASQDLVIGTPVANRSHPDVEPLIGFFANMLALRFDLSGNPSFFDLLERVRQTMLAAFQHEDVPFEQLVEELKPPRDLSYSPVFQAVFAMQNTPLEKRTLPGLNLEALDPESSTAKFDLTLSIEARHGILAGNLEYNSSLFNKERIERLVKHFCRFLNQLVAMPGRRLADFELADDEERGNLLNAWNNTCRLETRASSIHRRFEAQVAAYADAPALICEGGFLTYGELEERANRLAHLLREQGIGIGQRVGLTAPRSRRAMIAFLAILKTGGVCLPIDPSLPKARLRFLIDDAAPDLILTDPDTASVLPENTPLVFFEQVLSDTSPPVVPPPVTTYADNLAYLMYTSGSTGLPKAVEATHRGVLRLFARDGFLPFGRDLVWLQYAPFSFDASTLEIWGALLHGSPLACPPAGQLALDELALFIRRQHVNTLWLTAALFHVFVQEYPEAFEGVDYVLAGGDVVGPSTVRQLLKQRPGLTVINGYGPTENTTFTTVFPMTSWKNLPSVPIGYPIAETTVYLLDNYLRLVLLGAIGELYTGGEGLARAYLGQPVLTALAFVPDPFSKQPGKRLYRTGDLARWLNPDGAVPRLVFCGRCDFQVKIRGFRVEPGEIATVIEGFDEVRAAAVIYQPNPERLIAYLVADPSLKPEISAFLSEQLPGYMIPSALIFMDNLPLKPSGKLDLAALPDPEGSNEAEVIRPPKTVTEQLVASIWCELFQLDLVDRGAHFFELGGHSLLATRFVSRIKAHYGVSLPLASVFTKGHLDELASEIDGLIGVETDTRPALLACDNAGPQPLSFAQQRMWFLDRFEGDSSVYHIPTAVRLRGMLDTDVLERAFNLIVARHDTLRTSFREEEEQAFQHVAPYTPISLTTVDLSGAPDRVEAIARTQTLAPFNLARGPLYRLALLRLASEEHVLLWTTHHIASDGWSIGVMLKELDSLYPALQNQQTSPLAPLAVQYADFAVWQRSWLSDEVLTQKMAYWRRHLSGAPDLLELPTDRPRPAVQSYRGDLFSFRLGDAARVNKLAKDAGVSLFMTLSAAFATLLGRYSGRNDLVIGSPVACRTHPETEPLIGFFANMLPLRFDLSENPRFSQLLERVKIAVLDGFSHEDVPFEQLVEELKPERHMGYTPLFQVAFALQNPDLAVTRLANLELESLAATSTTAKFDLTLTVSEHPAQLIASLEYNTDIFELDRIRGLASHLALLLDQMVTEPERHLADYEIVSKSERERLFAWSQSQETWLGGQTLNMLFAEAALRFPDKAAIVQDNQVVTYQLLAERAALLAGKLRRMGACESNNLVGLMTQQGPDLPIGILGILGVGTGFVVLDPSLPEERIRFLLDDCQIDTVVCQPPYRQLLARVSARGEALRRIVSIYDAVGVPADLTAANASERLAYVIYTSGSSGKPKGVPISHDQLVPLMHWGRATFALGEKTRAMQSLNHAFDYGVFELMSPLLFGGTLCVPKTDERGLPDRFAISLRNLYINTLHATPSFFSQVVIQPQNLTAMRHLVMGAEVVERELVEAIFASVTDQCVVHNAYGPTEASIISTTYEIGRPGEKPLLVPVPIGKASGDKELYVLDGAGHMQAPGVPGELHIGGKGISRGYLGRPALSAEKFVPHPFAQTPGQRLYRSGDQVRFRADGQILFAGRIDDQVKVRGFRIELSEVRSTLESSPAVAQAVVLTTAESGAEKKIIAYLILEQGGAAHAKDAAKQTKNIRAFLAQHLPGYMIPAAFVFMDRFPLTPNGKLDRAALPEPNQAIEPEEYEAPATPSEKAIAQIWCDLFQLKQIHRKANFFELGGHSLMATRFISRIQSAQGVTLSLASVFTTPTLEGLAKEVDRGIKADVRPPLTHQQGPGPHVLSFAQQRLWFLDRFETDSSAYHIPTALLLKGRLDTKAMEQAFNAIVSRHDNVRTTFTTQAEQPRQVVGPHTPFRLRIVDLSAIPQKLAQAKAIAKTEATAPFQLTIGPLFRLKLLRLSPQEHILTWTTHHIASDGWSMGVMLKELNVLYKAFQNNEPCPLAPLSVQYADFAVWQRSWLKDEVLAEKMAYWREHLAGAPDLLELPTDRPRPAVQSYRGNQLSFRLSDAARVQDLGRASGASLFMTLSAAFATLLSRYSGTDDLVIGSPVACRNHPDIEPLIGFFANMIPLRFDLSGNPSFRQLLARVQKAALDGFLHEDVPFEQLVEELQPGRHLDYTPLFQVAFAQQNPDLEEAALADLQMMPLQTTGTTAKFDLTLTVAKQDDELIANLEYNTDLFDADRIQRLGAHLTLLLDQMTTAPNRRLADFELVTPNERNELRLWSRHKNVHPGGQSVDALFARAALRTPDKVALFQDSHVLTYQVLAQRAARLTGELHRLGVVGTNSVIGLMTEQGLDLPIGILGILGAGAAFVSLDPHLPEERIRYLLDDCRMDTVVCQPAFRQRMLDISAMGKALHNIVAISDGPDVPVQVVLSHRPERLAYVVYTSGSSGKPKGVPISHNELVPLLLWGCDTFGLNESTRALQSLNHAFDYGIFELLSPLLFGGTLFTAKTGERGLADRFAANIRDLYINIVHATPSFFSGVVSQPQNLHSLRHLIMGAEVVERELVEAIFASVSDQCMVYNAYGPTEASIISTTFEIGKPGQTLVLPVPIGAPCGDKTLYVMDRSGRLQPPGIPGELHIGGPGLSRGYLGQPALCAEKFVPNPFSEIPGQRLYRSGDQVRFRHDGNLLFSGRIDDQVKIRGFRVELAEIRSVLEGAPGVGQAAVLTTGKSGTTQKLLAYVIPTAGSSLQVTIADEELAAQINELKIYLSKHLPSYMIPSVFVFLERFPLTPNGKLDRAALPKPQTRTSETQFIAPGTGLERGMAAIWARLLGVEKVGTSDNFFELGGHSLLMVQLQEALKQELGHELTMVTLFEHPTIRALASHLERLGEEKEQAGKERGSKRRSAGNRDRDRRRVRNRKN